MKVSLCTITFRHCLLSLKDIAVWARANGFDGVELWGAHARNLARTPLYNAEWLASFGLATPMLSDYLPTEGERSAIQTRAEGLCRLAGHWRAGKIRTFAGARGSRATSAEERRAIVAALRLMCEVADDHGVRLLVETHPNTLADTLASTLRLVEEIDHAALGLNFDVLHVWEGGDDAAEAHRALRPWIRHYHLKNVRAREDLGVFEPANVYAAAGRREGMTPLFGGAFDYDGFLPELDADAEASLEWFGDDGFDVLARDRRLLEARSVPNAAVAVGGG
ncbi:sugar phosphate isomerase/epimerase family protein [Methylopila turkensis]|uniref:3-dehydroshikimate dehydratase n=1 Tax=Methylopila turkensis TaxID=1437816 RepID=A0A9W6JME8_9HYPH|nr:sugar phosphate isomerase/epimerase [Methylopila turkensis]GLK80326.1 3-dehydroshikimate dehydratase [Methylopila turkensis]